MSSWPEYKNVALPGKLVDRIDELIEKSNYKYASRPHVIKLALKDFFEKNEGNGGEKTDGITRNS